MNGLGRALPRHDGRGCGPLRGIVVLLLILLVPLLAPSSVAAQDTDLVDPLQQTDIVPVDPNTVPADPNAAVDLGAQQSVVVPPAAPGPDPNWAPPVTVYIPETGQALDRLFLDMWRGWGGANAFGYPLTPEFEENGRTVQYLNYTRFEYWPEDSENPVHLGDLGHELRPLTVRRTRPGASAATSEAMRVARAWLPLDASEARPDSDDYRYIPETRHSVATGFKSLWEATGAETYLGNPLTEEYILHGVTYQVFERGQLAWEPGIDPYLMPVGQTLVEQYRLDTTPVGQGDLPTYSEDLWIPPPAPSLSVEVDPNAERWLEVNISSQYAWARQGNVVLWEGYVSTGKIDFETPTGTFWVNSKIPVQNMEGVIGGEYYNVPEVPNVMYFTDRGHAIHGTYWHNNFGVPMSHGCINLPMDVAAWMYEWAPIGLRVEITP